MNYNLQVILQGIVYAMLRKFEFSEKISIKLLGFINKIPYKIIHIYLAIHYFTELEKD